MNDREYVAMCATRARLEKWGQALRAVEKLEKESAFILELLAGLADTLHAHRLTGMPPGSGPGDPVYEAVADMDRRRDVYRRELDAKNDAIERWMREHREMQALIERCLTPREAEIIDMVYRQGLPVGEISGKTNYSEGGVRKREWRARRKISRRL